MPYIEKTIISNSCVGGYLYRDYYKIPYNNPFIWCSIDFTYFIHLISKWDIIKFDSIHIERSNHNLVDLHFLHCIHDVKSKDIRIARNNIYYNNIEQLIEQKYMERLNRMNRATPTFIWAHSYKYLSQEELGIINSLDVPYTIYIFNDIICPSEKSNIKIVASNIYSDNKLLADYIARYNNAEILSNDKES